MATVGRGILRPAVSEFFDAVRSYDAGRAAKQLAPDADFASPWHGRLHGRDVIEAALNSWLGDPKTRPSLSITDVRGDGAVTHLDVTVSGRFGQAPQRVTMDMLCLKGVVHQVDIRAAGAPVGH